MTLETEKLTVSNLVRYPVKSAKEENLVRAIVLKTGIENDRSWMIINEQGKALTQRKKPMLANVNVSSKNTSLTVSVPGFDVCMIKQPNSKVWCKVEIWGDLCDALQIDHVLNDYLSDYLKTKCRLVVLNKDKPREITGPAAKGLVSFADAFPFLIIGSASLVVLNNKLSNEVSMRNFRPNIVVNTRVAHEEDTWDEIQIGGVVFKNVRLCSRCILTTINPDTAVFSKDQEPLQTLLTYRKIQGKIMFGSNLIALNEGEIKKGDEVKILSYKNNITNQ